MSNKTIVPCPCCGSPAEVYKQGHREYRPTFSVVCRGCGLRTKPYDSNDEAIELWNTRKPMERIVERLEEINYNDIQMAVSEVLEKYGFPKECVVQDEIWDELDGLCTSKPVIEIVKEECGINE